VSGVRCQQTPNTETRLRGRSRYGAAKARNLNTDLVAAEVLHWATAQYRGEECEDYMNREPLLVGSKPQTVNLIN